jgi:hypothetical protein
LSRGEDIAAGLARVKDRIAAAERAAGRGEGSVRLVAVSKKMTAEDVRAALAAGQLDLGESYGQELRDKLLALAGAAPAPRWHFIGPLQANKVKYVAGKVALVHSVDSPELLDELERRGADQTVLVQVNVAGEAQKRGVAPAALPALLDRFATLAHVRCAGLMTVPPLADDPAARPGGGQGPAGRRPARAVDGDEPRLGGRGRRRCDPRARRNGHIRLALALTPLSREGPLAL